MKVAILGAGGIGLGMSALLSSKGVEARIWGPTSSGLGTLLDGNPILCRGILRGEFHVGASLDIAKVVDDADLIVLAVPGNAHRAVIDLVAPHVCPGQHVTISSHLSLSALYLSRQLGLRKVGASVSAWASTIVTARRLAPAEVDLSSVREQVIFSRFASEPHEHAYGELEMELGTDFTQAPDLMTVTLMNVGPSAHLATALCNLTRMERGERWGSYYGISGTVGGLVEALDCERLALASRFGLSVHTVREHWHRSFGLPLGSVAEMAAEQHARRNGAPLGPATLDHRYVTEDVPFGVVPLVRLGRIAGVEMPTHSAGLHLLTVLYGRNFAAENELFDRMCIDDMDASELLLVCREGYHCKPSNVSFADEARSQLSLDAFTGD